MRPRTAFVLTASDQGTMIVNRFDWHQSKEPDYDGAYKTFGVGWEIMHQGSHANSEVSLCCHFLQLRRRHFGDGVVVIDGGANIGSHTIAFARAMMRDDDEPDWGSVIAIEAQERCFGALWGNITLNNCFNARALHAVLGEEPGVMVIPEPDYRRPMSFGSLELTDPIAVHRQDIGQAVTRTVPAKVITIDGLSVQRCDFLKLDVEGMEMAALRGGADLIATCHPIIVVEWTKSDQGELHSWLADRGYDVFSWGPVFVAVHSSDPCRNDFSVETAEPPH